VKTHSIGLLIALCGPIISSCALQLVAPYNADIGQKASAMQAEVSAWELTMRQGAGTVADDPRYPDVSNTLNRWRGEAEAMLTVAVSGDPGNVNCSEAAKAVFAAFKDLVPPELLSQQKVGGTPPSEALGSKGCESALVADLGAAIEKFSEHVKWCQIEWIPDSYFQNKNIDATKVPAPSSPEAARGLYNRCFAEFKAPEEDSNVVSRHGRAVSHALTTLQAIVYLENRKKAAASKQ
jgi:hypothetical protein